MADEARWYVVHTYSGYENKVADSITNAVENRQLHDLIHEVKIPTEMVVEVKDNQKKEVDSWYVVRNIRGVTGFVGPGSKPIPLTEEEVARFGVETREVEVSYKVGDSVMVSGGYMEGFIGTVDEIDMDKQIVRVTVSMMGKEVPVELDLAQVQPLA